MELLKDLMHWCEARYVGCIPHPLFLMKYEEQKLIKAKMANLFLLVYLFVIKKETTNLFKVIQIIDFILF